MKNCDLSSNSISLGARNLGGMIHALVGVGTRVGHCDDSSSVELGGDKCQSSLYQTSISLCLHSITVSYDSSGSAGTLQLTLIVPLTSSANGFP